MRNVAVATRHADRGYWGQDPNTHSSWKSHSNRLIPVYRFGNDLHTFSGQSSLCRGPLAIETLDGYLPDKTVTPKAEYFYQTDVYRPQNLAIESGKRRPVLCGDEGIAAVVSWIEQHGGWDETALILTADHGHYFNHGRPQAFIQSPAE